MNLYFYLFCLLYYLFCKLETFNTEKVSYIATEHPRVIYYNKQFVRNVSVTSRRYTRDNLIYYINIYADTLVLLGNDVSVDFYFFEYQGNRYYRTYVELHAMMCDFVDTSTLFGDTLKKAVGNQGCPLSPGPHLFSNLTIPIKSIPNSFPYRQGRLICNTSITHRGTTYRLAEATIDLEVKVVSRNKITNKGSLIN